MAPSDTGMTSSKRRHSRISFALTPRPSRAPCCTASPTTLKRLVCSRRRSTSRLTVCSATSRWITPTSASSIRSVHVIHDDIRLRPPPLQVEGLVADRNLSLKHLIGMIRTFFEAIGITQLRFKPAFNPYTEPSMEVFGFHPDLGKWTEIGNSGMFRPEMLAPMGLPPDVRVIAWGLSLERPTMIKYRIRNIRDLFGHKVDLNMMKESPLARFP
mmetsp:Transcript_38043/g.65686  ORF Transcript_38043/g.65686 Transcript_38043/m.65686 type:complete len:214 (-) Transcript_38043:94-735(-)